MSSPSIEAAKMPLANPVGPVPGNRARVSTPWLTVTEAADRARCGVKVVYRAVSAGRLQAVRLGGRRELRLRAEWVDQWLTEQTTIR